MKTLILGDIHGRTCWYDIIEDEQPDKIIFLGDYVSTHETISSQQQCSNLEDILNFKEGFGENCILLRGNHDMQHLGYSWAACSGLDRSVQNYMMQIKDRFLKLTQWVYVQDNVVFSHAGISKVWMENVKLDDVNKINDLPPSEKFGFWPCKLSDYSGDSATQPPTWIRPWTLIHYAFGDYTYVVGHTCINYYSPGVELLNDQCIKGYKGSWVFDENDEKCKAQIEFYNTTNKIWCCDALPHSYLIIEDGEFIPCKFME